MAFMSSGSNGLSPEQSSYLIPLKSSSTPVAAVKVRRKPKSSQTGGNLKQRKRRSTKSSKSKKKRGRKPGATLKRLGGQVGGGKGKRKKGAKAGKRRCAKRGRK